MKQVIRALALVVTVCAAGCANGGPTPAASVVPTIASPPQASGSTATEPAPSSPDASTPTPVSPTPASPAVRPSYPTAAESGGWRLVITRPASGTTVGPSATICYQATGTTREATVALDVSVVSPGSSSTGAPTRLGAAVGAGSVQIDLTGVPSGRFDLRIALVGDGQLVDGVVVTIPDLVVGPPTTDQGCPQ